MTNLELLNKLNTKKTLAKEEWIQLIASQSEIDRMYAAALARDITLRIFGKKIYFRGIVEFSNYCKNDCHYCGINRSNPNCNRYRLTKEDILECCRVGHELGYRTFVLQGGEDTWFTDERVCEIICEIHAAYPDCAITLSLGERERTSYQKFFDAGADRYLLRHETADEEHYQLLHPSDMSWTHRMNCLKDLKDIGFQTGCGFMVGTPGQTPECLAKDMMFIHDFKPHMIGIGPFIPHKDTPFRDKPAGDTDLTLFMLSLCRILQPDVLLPSTTALGTVSSEGRQMGVLAGCNVIMPNLSPLSVRQKYMLYDNKVGTASDAADGIRTLTKQMQEIGYEICVGRGDFQVATQTKEEQSND